MCLMEPATVLEARPDEAVVEAEGRSIVLPNFFVPDLAAGDSVVIGMGHVLGRLSAADAAELRRERALAYDGVDEPVAAVAPAGRGRNRAGPRQRLGPRIRRPTAGCSGCGGRGSSDRSDP